MGVPDTSYQLKGISPRAFQHPADRAATAALHQVPYLDQVIKKLIQLGYERALRQAYLGSSVRLGQEQLPGIWVLERGLQRPRPARGPGPVLTQMPFANAFTIGAGEPIIVLNSELVKLLDNDGRARSSRTRPLTCWPSTCSTARPCRFCCDFGAAPPVGRIALARGAGALLEWARAAELTCDRGAAVVTRQPMAVCKSLMALAGGQAADELNLDAFIAQGLDYREEGSGLEKLTRL